MWLISVVGDQVPIRYSLVVSAVTLSFALAGSPAHADQSSPIATGGVPSWLGTCATAFENTPSLGSRCIAYQAGSVLANQVAPLVNEQGRALFGDGFGVVQRLSWSPNGNGIAGNLDAIIPLASFGGAASLSEGRTGVADASALFLQHGVTTWTDRHGFRRNDLRHGTVYRTALSETAIVGFSAFLQENIERGHQRLVTSIDYAGQWGIGWLQHFSPITGWRLGRAGHEERALGETELGVRLKLTTTLSADAAMASWESNAYGHDRVLEERLGLGWRPHSWLSFNAGWGKELGQGVGNVLVKFAMPLGNARRPARWEGLGTLGVASTSLDIWRPVTNVAHIRTVERATGGAAAETDAPAVSARFLQDVASSGDTIDIEVLLSSPASQDTPVQVRLLPGGGNNPAVPGVDYVDEPLLVTVPSGYTTARTTAQLIQNDGLSTPRTLAVAATLAN